MKITKSDLKSDLHDILSLYLRELCDWKCQKCGKQHPRGSGKLGNSHYISRGDIKFAYDIDNLDPLCWFPCHQRWESMKNTEYRVFMINKLGLEKLEWMELVANTVNPASLDDATIKKMPADYLQRLIAKQTQDDISTQILYYVELYKRLCLKKGVENLWLNKKTKAYGKIIAGNGSIVSPS